MAEYIGEEEKKTSVEEPLIFVNKTDHAFEVRTGIVFNSGGIYEIAITGNRTIVSKVSDISNKWIPLTKDTIPPYWELVWVTNKRGQVDVCQLGHTEHYWYSREEEWRYEFDSIIAWMPYEEPEPYRVKGDCIKTFPSAQPEWNNHTVACLLAELFGDSCACNYNGIDEWLPEKCEVIDGCPNPVGVACWEQFLKYRAERRTDE